MIVLRVDAIAQIQFWGAHAPRVLVSAPPQKRTLILYHKPLTMEPFCVAV